VTVGAAGEPALGYTWRIWSGGTSFYMKSRIPGMKHLKLSLHGDDPRHPAGGGFKIAMDTEEAYERDLAAGSIISQRTGEWPLWFPGQTLKSGATLVARLRWTYEAISRLGPAPNPGDLKADAIGLAIKAPPEVGDAVDLDLIINEGKPYWHREKESRVDNACLGPIYNEASGLWLTGTAVKRFVPNYPHPVDMLGPRPRTREDQVRGLACKIDPAGFLWMVEHRMSKSAS
jgi:hypothetical protein